jgi:hypothetical protein
MMPLATSLFDPAEYLDRQEAVAESRVAAFESGEPTRNSKQC